MCVRTRVFVCAFVRTCLCVCYTRVCVCVIPQRQVEVEKKKLDSDQKQEMQEVDHLWHSSSFGGQSGQLLLVKGALSVDTTFS